MEAQHTKVLVATTMVVAQRTRALDELPSELIVQIVVETSPETVLVLAMVRCKAYRTT